MDFIADAVGEKSFVVLSIFPVSSNMGYWLVVVMIDTICVECFVFIFLYSNKCPK